MSSAHPDVVLYHGDTCRYCIKVRDFLDKEGIEIPQKEVWNNPEFFEELYAVSGRTQVPCLVINGTPMLESDDIIKWFKENW